MANARDAAAMAELKGALNFLLVTANANFDWPNLLATLSPKGRLHVVGVVPDPIGVPIFPLILGQNSVSASPVGSPGTVAKMLDFTARHKIRTVIEKFPLSRVNDALERLRSGRAQYRIVLQNDLG